MASPVKKRRWSVPNRSLRFSGSDRLKLRYRKSEDGANKTYNPESLILITRHNWHLYRASKLHDVKYNKVKLKQYAARIRNELIQCSIETSNIAFKVSVEALTELKKSAEDADSLQIDVFSEREVDNPVLKYRGVFLSWGCNNAADDFTQLPLLLCTGTAKVTKIVHRALNKLFETELRPLRISSDNLMCISAVLSDSDRTTSVSFDFVLHGSRSGSKISFSLPSALVKTLWNHIHSEESEYISYVDIQNYHRLIQDQLEAYYGFNFKIFKLNKIFMCDATISCEGRIKINTEEAAVEVLSFIHNLSLILDQACPDMIDKINDTL